MFNYINLRKILPFSLLFLMVCITQQVALANTDQNSDRYEVYPDGTVYDKVTNLTWMACSLGQNYSSGMCNGDAQLFTWYQASDTAKKSVFGERNDWRLPTLQELSSLVYCDTGKRTSISLDKFGYAKTINGERQTGVCIGYYQAPTIYRNVFPNTPASFYEAFWTSTEVNENEIFAQTIAFDDGLTAFYNKNNKHYVRLVRDTKSTIKYKKDAAAYLHDALKSTPNSIERFKLLYEAAKLGNIGAQKSIAVAYKDGLGVTKDLNNSAHWYRVAAEQGDKESQTSLGMMYLLGKGVRTDIEQAELWLTKASSKGDGLALFVLGGMYRDGIGVEKNLEEAKNLFHKSCINGFKKACKY